MRLSVVYFIFLNPAHAWRELLSAQLRDLVTFKLDERAADIHIVISGDSTSNFAEAEAIARALLPAIHIHMWPHNHYEYPALDLVHRLAGQSKDPTNHLILYHHSKGMVNSTHSEIRTRENLALTQTVIAPWLHVEAQFLANPNLMKAGYAAASGGWIWFNFWWARASYLRRVSQPRVTTNRWLHEEWLAHVKDVSSQGYHYCGAADCLSLCSGEIGVSLPAEKAFRSLVSTPIFS